MKLNNSARPNLTIMLEPPPFFKDLCPPGGYLGEEKAEHACMYYSMLAFKVWEQREKNRETLIVLEGNPDPDYYPDYQPLLTGVALRYGLQPEELTKCWKVVDMTYDLNGWERVPDMERIRFNTTPEIKTQ